MSVYEYVHSTETQVPEVVLIIPALNEASRLGGEPFKKALDSNMSQFSREFIHDSERRMVVVDDGSTDKTAELASEFGYEVVRNLNNQGKGASIRNGVRAILSSLIEPNLSEIHMVFTDADGSYSADTALELIEATRGGADIAIAKRKEVGSTKRSWRDLAHPAVKQMVRIVTPTGVSDPQAGAMAFTGRSISLWESSVIDRYATPTEVLYKAHRLGLNSVEVDAEMIGVAESHVRPIDGLKMLYDTTRIRLNSRH